MNKSSRIYVAGHTGLVGTAIVRKLKERGYNNIITRAHSELELLDYNAVFDFFNTVKSEYVFLAAARVGGILANNTYRAQFIYENLQIQNNVIHAAYLSGVKKLLFLGSSCIYPKNAPQPIKEDYLLTSELEFTNEPYAIAKIAGIKMCESYNLQYGTNFISVMPTNLYGPSDNYDLEKSHVLPAIIRKMHLAKCLECNDWEGLRKDLNRLPVEGVSGNSPENEIVNILNKYGIRVPQKSYDSVTVTLWGSGKPMREFLHSNDMADACVFIMENIDFQDLAKDKNEVKNTHINIGAGVDISIFDLAQLVKEIVGYRGQILWDTSKPDGTYRKLLDVSKLNSLGWKYKIELATGIKNVYNDYLKLNNK
ncbi:GDP-L-fucose synthase family protein [Tenuifilum thalassicum]|uniref:GDP-L-fucose synthase n=1 Tax=Tenuifilum thalassicum TaxID=2590900 RepID=A0A7D4BDY9_9BACT|nr:GDP-L-fucose synthase [Tenuifilum thalassicum]QKG80223.1 GDP-L-fucose synthase [Tenuifilum thalassicum]